MEELANQFMNSYIKSPIFWFIILLGFLACMFLPEIMERRKIWVKQHLRKLSRRHYKILNNVMIEILRAPHAIDHIIVSIYGIFIIEARNYDGLIKGKSGSHNWEQIVGDEKYIFYNPVKQVKWHTQMLQGFLDDFDDDKFIPIVVFSNKAEFDIVTRTDVVNLDLLLPTIRSHQIIKFTKKEVKEIVAKINNERLYDSVEKRVMKERIEELYGSVAAHEIR